MIVVSDLSSNSCEIALKLDPWHHLCWQHLSPWVCYCSKKDRVRHFRVFQWLGGQDETGFTAKEQWHSNGAGKNWRSTFESRKWGYASIFWTMKKIGQFFMIHPLGFCGIPYFLGVIFFISPINSKTWLAGPFLIEIQSPEDRCDKSIQSDLTQLLLIGGHRVRNSMGWTSVGLFFCFFFLKFIYFHTLRIWNFAHTSQKARFKNTSKFWDFSPWGPLIQTDGPLKTASTGRVDFWRPINWG